MEYTKKLEVEPNKKPDFAILLDEFNAQLQGSEELTHKLQDKLNRIYNYNEPENQGTDSSPMKSPNSVMDDLFIMVQRLKNHNQNLIFLNRHLDQII